ncbi:MAG: hypothetical protein ACD_75C00135G0001, partial [uncultured bacterium]
MGSEGNDGNLVVEDRRPDIADVPGCLEPVHDRHLNIHQNQIVGSRRQQVQCLCAVGRGIAPQAEPFYDPKSH